MSETLKNTGLFFALVALLLIVGTGYRCNRGTRRWRSFNMGLISAIMALGVNMQWGYAGLFNVGVMGFVALGGLAAVLVSMPACGARWIGFVHLPRALRSLRAMR
jgi:branched-chain amino acid transport system permease protein